MNLLYGSEVAAHVDLLIPLIICTILTAFSWLLCGVLTAIHQFRGLVIGNAVAVVASIILSPVLEQAFKMQGASLALGLATCIESAILLLYLMRDIRKHFE